MKTLILSSAVALSLGAAVIPASAQSVVIGGGGGRDCQMVEKRVIKNNKTIITKERVCGGDRQVYRDDDRRERYVERRDDRRDDRPGVYIDR